MKRIVLFLKKNKLAIVTLLLVALVGDILLIKFKSDLITFSIYGLVITFFKFYGYTSKRIFALCSIPIIIVFFGFLINPGSLVIEKASVWLFLLIGAGSIQELMKKDMK